MTGAIAYPKHHLPAGEDFLLLSPTVQAYAYRNVDRMFATRPIRRGTMVLQLQRGAEISPRYEVDGNTHGVDTYMDRANVAGLLVIRDERIVLERYALGLEENVRWSSMSTIKSLTATLVGAALQQGAIGSLDDAVSRYIPALRGCAYDAVTIRHLITMSSGVRWNEDYTDRNSDVNRYSKSLGDKVPGGVLALMRSLEALHRPGTHFNYNSGDTYVLGSLVSAATGKRLADYMSETIWSRLGMEFEAFYTLESDDGQEIGGSRAGMTLRDIGRFAQFVLDDGVVNGERILPEGWVAQSGTPAFQIPADLHTAQRQALGLTAYGYSWWLREDGAMMAMGHSGQRIFIDTRAQLAVVQLAAYPEPRYLSANEPDRDAGLNAFIVALREASGAVA
jgi:CubicO group peptidase (beta-lactamase class C family)